MVLAEILSIFTTVSLVISPDILNPDVGVACSGSKIGLVDAEKHVMVDCEYSRIDYLGHDLFLAWSINPTDRFEYGDQRCLVNKFGNDVTPKVPAGSRFIQVCYFGRVAELNPSLTLNKLPSDALIRFSTNNRFGLCTPEGEVVLAPSYRFISSATEGKVIISEQRSEVRSILSDSNCEIFDCGERKVTASIPCEIHLQGLTFSEGLIGFYAMPAFTRNGGGYMDAKGTVKIAPRFGRVGPFVRGLATVKVITVRKNLGYSEQSRTIDKNGRFKSPPNLDVEQFYGDYAVAREVSVKPARYGLVNRKFRFVVKPKYTRLSPYAYKRLGWLDNVAIRFSENAAFYSAVEEGQKPKYITCKGADLRTLPIEYEGQQLVISPDDLQAVRYFQITSDRFLKINDEDDGKFDSTFWINEHYWSPMSRFNMFGRFLREHDLIGMPKSQVIALLGPGRKSYQSGVLVYGININCSGGIQLIISLSDNKVCGWHLENDGQKTEMITTNILVGSVLDDGPFSGKLPFAVTPK